MIAKRKPHVDECLNCGTATPGAFCSGCGQEAVDAAVTLRDQLADFFSEVVTLEERLPQTIRLLLTKPGELTRAYNAGQRVRYVTPLKLYLFTGVLFFLVMSLVPESSGAMIQVQPGGHTPQMDQWFNEETASLFGRHLRHAVRAAIDDPKALKAAMVDVLSRATMVLVPVHALLLLPLYRRPKRFYGEHIVFSFHAHSFGYLVFTAATLTEFLPNVVSSIAGIVAFFATATYVLLAMRTAYGESLGRSLWKAILVGTGYLMALVAVFAIASMIGIFTL
jgi:hypothetical protein